MITLWYVKVKLDLSELKDIPDRYYRQALEMLVADGLYDEEGNKV